MNSEEQKVLIDKFEQHLLKSPINYELLKEYIEQGVDVNELDPPLLFYVGETEFYIFALENGADPNKICGWKHSSISHPSRDSGFQMCVRSKSKNKEDKYKLIKLALEKGADINYKNKEGLTALDFAIKTRDKKLIELLKSYGAESTQLELVNQEETKKVISINELEINPFEEETYLEDEIELIQDFIDKGYDLNAIYLDESYTERTILNYCVYHQSYNYKKSKFLKAM